jgi:hypothetical protein
VSALLSSDLLHLPRRTPGEGFACDVLLQRY